MSSSTAPQNADIGDNPFLVATGRGAPGQTAQTPVTSNPFFAPASGQPTDHDRLLQDPFLTGGAAPHDRPSSRVDGNDRFLTQGRPQAGADSQGREVLERVDGNDPFLTHARTPAVADPQGREVLDRVDGNDPFLTHARPPAVADPHGREVVQDPFLLGAGVTVPAPHGRVMEKVSKDPFLVSDSPTPLPKEGAASYCVRKTSRQCTLFGGWCFGCTGRRCEFGNSAVHAVEAELVLWPWCLLLAVIVLLVVSRGLLQWVAKTLCWFLVLALLVAGRSIPTVRRMQVRMVLCTIAGIFIGQWVFELYGRQYWWMHDGVEYDSAKPLLEMPAASRADAAWIHFSVGGELADPSDAHVDTSRSAGYRDGDTWCVAPILSEDIVANSVYPRVEYWAIGKGCCGSLGAFTCDYSREYTGEYGVPVVGGWADGFSSAAAKAEAVYGMVSAEGSLPIRFVDDPKAYRSGLGEDIFRFVCLVALVSFIVLYVLAVFDSAMSLSLPGYGEKASIAVAALGPKEAKEVKKRAYTNHVVLGVTVMLSVGLAAIIALSLGMMGTAAVLIVILVFIIFLLATVSAPEKDPKLVAVEKHGGGPGFNETLEHGGYGSSQSLAGGGGAGGAASDFLLTATVHQQLHG